MEFIQIKNEKNEKNFLIKCISLLTEIDYKNTEEDYLNFLKREKIKKSSEKTIINKFIKLFHLEPIKHNNKTKLKDLDLDDGKYIVFCKDKLDFDHTIYIDQNRIYAKYKNLLDSYVVKIYKQNELILYKVWMDNYSFFSNNLFVLKELTTLSKIGQITENKFILKIDEPKISLSKVSYRKSIKLAQDYFNKHKIDIKIKKLFKSENLKMEKHQDNTIRDAAYIVHELTHHRNHPLGENRNLISNILTESISYANELIFSNELKNENYKKFFNQTYIENLYLNALNLHYIYKILRVYKSKNSLDREDYINYHKKDDYDRAVKEFSNFVKKGDSVFTLSCNLLGRCMGLYMYTMYIKENSFFKKIEKLSDCINNLDMIECLNIIDLEDFKDFVKKYEKSCDTYLDMRKGEDKNGRN